MPLQRAQGLKMQFKMTWSLLWNGKVAVETMAFTKKGAVQKEMGSPNYFKFTRELKSAKI